MGILARIFGGAASAGTHPDSAIRTTERGDAQRYVTNQYTCPSCRRKGSKEIRGHASVLRKLTNGQARFYDVYNVFCGCGTFSTFWSDSTAWITADMLQAAEFMCKPNGKCTWIMGSGQMPRIDPSVLEAEPQG